MSNGAITQTTTVQRYELWVRCRLRTVSARGDGRGRGTANRNTPVYVVSQCVQRNFPSLSRPFVIKLLQNYVFSNAYHQCPNVFSSTFLSLAQSSRPFVNEFNFQKAHLQANCTDLNSGNTLHRHRNHNLRPQCLHAAAAAAVAWFVLAPHR